MKHETMKRLQAAVLAAMLPLAGACSISWQEKIDAAAAKGR